MNNALPSSAKSTTNTLALLRQYPAVLETLVNAEFGLSQALFVGIPNPRVAADVAKAKAEVHALIGAAGVTPMPNMAEIRFALECALDYANKMAPEDAAAVRTAYDSIPAHSRPTPVEQASE